MYVKAEGSMACGHGGMAVKGLVPYRAGVVFTGREGDGEMSVSGFID